MRVNTSGSLNVHTYMHTYVHTYIHTYVRTYIHTYIHTYLHKGFIWKPSACHAFSTPQNSKNVLVQGEKCISYLSEGLSMYVCTSPHMYGCFKNLLVQGRKWTFHIECHTYMNNAFWMPYMNNWRRKLVARRYSCMYGIQCPKFIFLLVQGGFWNSHTYAETYIHT